MFTENWTGELVGLMHNYKITKKELADKLGLSREYVSMVLNGHRNPTGAKERFCLAAYSIMLNEREEAR